MNIIEISKRINKTRDNEDWVDITQVGNQLNLCLDYTEQDRLKSYWIGNWYCTDTWVGYKIYFLDNEAVAFSIQNGRKSDEEFHWLSKNLAMKTKEYLISFLIKEDLDINICDINEDLGDSYKIEFNSEILSCNKPMFNGEEIVIVERVRYENDCGIDRELKIRLSSGEEKIVNISELDFRYYID